MSTKKKTVTKTTPGEDCTSSSCGTEYKGKTCACYAEIDTQDPDGDQICAFENDGFLVPCDPGCCSHQCPREACPDVKRKRPDRYAPTGPGDDDPRKRRPKHDESKPLPTYIKVLLIILAALIVLGLLFFALS